MHEFYHVSRADISSARQFDLMHLDSSIECPPLFTSEDFKNHKGSLYPNGISKHGERYLHGVFKSDGPGLAFAPNELLIETTFELVRRLMFPEKMSRFVSTFGCLTIDDARVIKADTFGNVGHIYRVGCEKFLKADMSLVRQAGCVIGMQLLAEKYWSGLDSGNPFWEVLMESPVQILDRVE